MDLRIRPAVKLQIEGRKLHLRVGRSAEPQGLPKLALRAGLSPIAAVSAAKVEPRFRLLRRRQHAQFSMRQIRRPLGDRRQRDVEDPRHVIEAVAVVSRALSHLDRFDHTAAVDQALREPSPVALRPAGRHSRHRNRFMKCFFESDGHKYSDQLTISTTYTVLIMIIALKLHSI